MSKLLCVPIAVLAGLVCAIAAYNPLCRIFLYLSPDCAPSQIDGQCGLATFMDMLSAVGCAALIWLAVAIPLSIWLLRRVRHSSAQ